jgi:hypothetical protein
MEVDEMLFEAFAPKRLKNVLEHGKTIELKPLRRVFGLDLAPVLKLLLTSTMLGLMVGFSIAPQTEYLIAAGDAMCGTCGQCCRARPPAPHGAVRPGLRRWSARLGIRFRQGAAPFAFFWKAYLSIEQPLTAHGPIHLRCQAGTTPSGSLL